MIRPIEDKKPRKKRHDNKKLQPKPHWAEAFMVLLLAKTGGKVSLSIEQLDAFSKVKGDDATNISYDEETEMVTLSLPEKVKIKLMPIIAVPGKEIITGIN
ncbi:hypothetical protein LCGC14_0400340 [marine sediment metagenome]|uniref:Uncharacterized protein n=1 Tax=marine sediment metagenome TaxID=412755 RepID=A0A0F9T2K5_9ZZZZ